MDGHFPGVGLSMPNILRVCILCTSISGNTVFHVYFRTRDEVGPRRAVGGGGGGMTGA